MEYILNSINSILLVILIAVVNKKIMLFKFSSLFLQFLIYLVLQRLSQWLCPLPAILAAM